jgi:4-alpha-glucanotransferase
LYRWDYHRDTGFDWWITRLYHTFRLYDAVRLDHFRGFDEYFSVPFGAKSALTGHWEKGPGMDLFNTLRWRLGEKELIVEDLGLMTDSVRKLVKDSGFPNMKVLQFAFDPDDEGKTNDYLPHNYDRNCVVYTGTHDNETVAGWYKSLKKKEKLLLREYLDDYHTEDAVFYKSINRMAMASVADTCILPLQDVLGLDNSARMNQPSTVKTNWRWRMAADMLTKEAQKELLELTKRYGRFNWFVKK